MSPSDAEPRTGQPFAAEPLSPRSLSPKGDRPAGGCGKPALIGCAAVVVLLGLAAVIFLLKARDLFGWLMVRFEDQVVASLPDDVTDDERERLHAAFVAASEAVQSGRADAAALQRMQSTLSRGVVEGEGKLTRQEVVELIVALEEVAGAGRDAPPLEDRVVPPAPSEALPGGGPPSAALGWTDGLGARFPFGVAA